MFWVAIGATASGGLSWRVLDEDCGQAVDSSWRLQADRSTPSPPSAVSAPALTRTPHATPPHARLCLPPPAAPPRCTACRHTSRLVVTAQIADGYKQVAALLDHLNVDAANPLAVLTQVRTAHVCCCCCSRSQSFFWGGQAGGLGAAGVHLRLRVATTRLTSAPRSHCRPFLSPCTRCDALF